jgi:hypothetical protein
MSLVRITLIIILLSAPAITDALAHSWYDPECCSERDCAPVTTTEQVNGGAMMTTEHGTVFVPNSYKPMRISQDGKWHVCMTTLYTGEKKLLCVYGAAGT